jgi:hypothetical protein
MIPLYLSSTFSNNFYYFRKLLDAIFAVVGHKKLVTYNLAIDSHTIAEPSSSPLPAGARIE